MAFVFMRFPSALLFLHFQNVLLVLHLRSCRIFFQSSFAVISNLFLPVASSFAAAHFIESILFASFASLFFHFQYLLLFLHSHSHFSFQSSVFTRDLSDFLSSPFVAFPSSLHS